VLTAERDAKFGDGLGSSVAISADGSALVLGAVRRPLRPLWRPFRLRFTYVTSVLVKKD
jgi:hypothetical protein